MTAITRRRLASLIASLGLVAAGLLVQLVGPPAPADDTHGPVAVVAASLAPTAAEAVVTTRVCASRYGRALYYDTNYRNADHWHRFARGACRNVDANDKFKTSGRSIALVRNLYRVFCVPYSQTRIDPTTDGGILQGYARSGCRN